MIVSGEVKMGHAESRARNRRRIGESDSRHREVAVESSPVNSSATIRGVVTSSAPILVDDEDDDVVVSSPRSYAHARVESHRSIRQARVSVEEDNLELRLGPGGGTPEYSLWTNFTRQGHRRRPARPTIDLTTPSRQAPLNDDCVVLHEYTKSRKRKYPVPLEPSFMTEIPPITPVHEAEEYKLKCPICMDTLKEETSTICGHIFCHNCIRGAIISQKKCPTCRKKLTLKNTHRIYL